MATTTAPRLEPGLVTRNLARVRERIEAACARSGRSPADVTLVGVTKTVPSDPIREALDAGLTHLGENRVQEAIPKMVELADRAPTWHLIGHLQTNKARKAVDLFDVIESVDSLRLAETLEAEAEDIGRALKVFAQVNVGEEPSKGGLAPADLLPAVERMDLLPSLRVVGLMAIPPVRASRDDSRRDFAEVRRLFEALQARHPEIVHLSMGMSSDYEIAIEEGATEVRVGSALFGSRP